MSKRTTEGRMLPPPKQDALAMVAALTAPSSKEHEAMPGDFTLPLRVTAITPYVTLAGKQTAVRVELSPNPGGSEPDESWAFYRDPDSGELDIVITNPAAFALFTNGDEYVVTITKAERTVDASGGAQTVPPAA